MKVKLKFDKNTILKLLEEHVEKLVLGVLILLALGIAYRGVAGRDQMEKSPVQLREQVTRARGEIEQNKTVALVVRDYDQLAKQSLQPIKESPYDYETLLAPRIFPVLETRGDPKLYAVEGLRGTAEFGSFRVASQMGEQEPEKPLEKRPPGHYPPMIPPRGEVPAAASQSNIEGLRWIVITGLVPAKKQNSSYRKAFQSAQDYDYQTDVPVYLGYKVQRIEAPPSGDTKNIPEEIWKTKAVEDKYARVTCEGFYEKWGGGSREVVPENCCLPELTFPLGPLAEGQEWSSHVAYDPEIPYYREGEGQYGFMPESEKPAADEARSKEDKKSGKEGKNFFLEGGENRSAEGGVVPPSPRGPGPAAAPLSAGPSGMNRFPSGRLGGGMIPRDPYGRLGGGMFPRGSYGRLGEGPTGARPDESLDYYLLRYFDFKVEPGKRYVYRVKLVLANPNYDKGEIYLQNPNLGKNKLIETDWSDPTGPVYVPLDTRMYVKSVKPTVRADGEPSGTVMLVKWMANTGDKVYHECSVDRGQVLNTKKVKVDLVPMNIYTLGPPQTENTTETELISDILVLDMDGGQRLPGSGRERLTAPAEMLVMDPDGSLAIRSELEDSDEVTMLAAASQASSGAGFEPFEGPSSRRPPPGMEGRFPPQYPGRPGMEGRFPQYPGRPGMEGRFPQYPGRPGMNDRMPTPARPEDFLPAGKRP